MQYNIGMKELNGLSEVQVLIQELRDKGWPISAIGREMGTHSSTIWRWASGDKNPDNVRGVVLLLRHLLKGPLPKRLYRPKK
jgi:hypothetical protein